MLGVFLLLLFLGRNVWLKALGVWVIKEDLPKSSNVIFLLGGTFSRGVLEAADLYHQGLAPAILFCDEHFPVERYVVSPGSVRRNP